MALIYQTPTFDPAGPTGFDKQDFGAPNRISVVPDWALPGSDANAPRLPAAPTLPYRTKPLDAALRFRVLDGDPYTDPTSSYATERSEVSCRVPKTSTGGNDWHAAAEKWPDPIGSERWHDWSLLLDDGSGDQYGQVWPVDTTGDLWTTLTQWKGYAGGSPPIAIELKRDQLRLGGANIARDLGAYRPGVWERLVVGMKRSTGTDGWVHVFRNGVEVLPQTAVRTMNLSGGKPDPTYVKQGIYRAHGWNVDHVAYHGPLTITDTMPAGLVAN